MTKEVKFTSHLKDGRGRFGLVGYSVMADPKLNHGAKALYGLLATYASPDRTAFPSINRLASEMGVTARTIARWLDDLQKLNYLRRTTRPGSTTLYVLLDGLSPVTPGSTDSGVSTDSDVTTALTPVSHEQTIEHKGEKSNDFSLVNANGNVTVFDALVFISFGPGVAFDSLGKSESGKFLRDGWGPIARMEGVTVDDVVRRAAEAYARGWSTVTAKTLANNWHDLGKPRPSRDEAKRALFLQRMEGLTQ